MRRRTSSSLAGFPGKLETLKNLSALNKIEEVYIYLLEDLNREFFTLLSDNHSMFTRIFCFIQGFINTLEKTIEIITSMQH